jgi:hypothetical protein
MDSQSSFEYSEKLFYLHHDRLCLRDVKQKKDLVEITLPQISEFCCKDYNISDEFSVGLMGYESNQLIIIRAVLYSDVKHIIKVNRKMQIIGQETIHKMLLPLSVLRKEIKRINFDFEQVIIKFAETCLPYDLGIDDKQSIKSHIPSYPDTSAECVCVVSGVCYDRHEDTIILIVHNPYVDTIEVWKRSAITTLWELQRKSESIVFTGELMEDHFGFYMISLYQLECSKHYIMYNVIVHMCDESLEKRRVSFIIDKQSFKILDMFVGCGTTFCDDYEDWLKNSLEQLKTIESLSKISTDVMNIILGYVS